MSGIFFEWPTNNIVERLRPRRSQAQILISQFRTENEELVQLGQIIFPEHEKQFDRKSIVAQQSNQRRQDSLLRLEPFPNVGFRARRLFKQSDEFFKLIEDQERGTVFLAERLDPLAKVLNRKDQS